MTLGYKTVGIVGLGKMGGSITERLLNRGTKKSTCITEIKQS